jgi:hypothetical protein
MHSHCSLTPKNKADHVELHVIYKELVKLWSINWETALADTKHICVFNICGNPDISQYPFIFINFTELSAIQIQIKE